VEAEAEEGGPLRKKRKGFGNWRGVRILKFARAFGRVVFPF
jgi:hypothetical protein